ncbi:MAG: hypothetical protein NTU44_07420 [Bacteroidetes bacterium]|nr:hypothetical protein [Bacteroidota bacterium]
MGSLTRNEIMQDPALQEAIIRHYFPEARQGKLFKVREERTPSANLKNFNGVLYLTDFGNEQKGKNCLDIIMEQEGCSFKDAMELVSSRFLFQHVPQPGPGDFKPSKVKEPVIRPKEFNQAELDYFGVSPETLQRFNIHALSAYNGLKSRPDYFLFLYDFGTFRKINKPHDKGSRFFWVGNRPRDFIFGWDQLPEALEMIILTAGEKDTLNLVEKGFPAVSLNSESARLGDDQLSRLLSRSDKLFVCFDLDEAGIKNAVALTRQHPGVYNIKLPDELRQHTDFRGNPCKDVADFFIYFTPHDFQRLMDDTVKQNKVKQTDEKDDSGTPLFTVVKNFLKKTYDLRFNEVANEYEYKLKGEAHYKELNESNVYVTLREKKIHVSLSDLTAILRSDFVTHYDPFKEYFESLPAWTAGKDPDHIEKVTSFFKMRNRSRFVMHFRKHLVRTIACALEENVFNKQAFVLVGLSQHSGKSTFCRWLCPPALKNYFAEDISTDKDSRISFCENFLINMDELSTLGKTEIQALKSLFSKGKEKLRRPYDRKTSVIPRRASFIGSTDRSEFLNDEAGTVRWLCMEIESIDFDYNIKMDINLVWSQAYQLYKDGFKYELNSEEIRVNEMENKRYQVVTLEMDAIQTYLMPGTPNDHDDFIYPLKFLELIQGYNKDTANKFSDIRLGKAFKSLGFVRSQKYENKMQCKGYYVRFTPEYLDRFGMPYTSPGTVKTQQDIHDHKDKQQDLPF